MPPTPILIGTSVAQNPGWPREKSNPNGTFIYYQPQLDEWKDFGRLEARMAFSIKPAGGPPTVGVVYLRAQTDANVETHNVVISKLEITSTRFPSLAAAAAAKISNASCHSEYYPSTRSITRYSIFAGVLRALGYNVADDDFELIDRIDYILRPNRRAR